MNPAAAPLQLISEPLLQEKQITLYLKREDLLHPSVPGNKWRKLKYNLREARKQQKTTLVTFGGAYSNHIAAVAAAGQEFGFQTIGYIRGEAHAVLNPTLTYAQSCGMHLHYLDRETYRQKQGSGFLQNIQAQHPAAYILPEGGTNLLAVPGCAEIINDIDVPYKYICCACGTGGTLAGIIAGLKGENQVIGFPALKGGSFLTTDIATLIREYTGQTYANWHLQTGYHFGGYARIKPDLITFIQDFKTRHQVQLEPIYTGKMLYGIYDLVQKGFFPPGSTIITIHTGGLQGLAGLEERLGITFN
jgi:1-aminocyclopropane-1-carboxylate deaminase/D-cysteine desulfhydrase-like pyridoxal-dependent ACC family enzyme